MNSSYGADDPWDNGWASESDPLQASTNFPSAYSSQLLTSNHNSTTSSPTAHPPPLTGNTLAIPPADVPGSYSELYGLVGSQCSTTNDLETRLFAPLIQNDLITSFQKTKILDICYDHNLLPASLEKNFYQIAGLIALELDITGSGDYVTLSFRKSNLPDLPADLIALFKVVDDPLSSQIEPDEEPKSVPATPTIGSAVPRVNAEPIDKTAMNKYLNGIRDRFRPLLNSSEGIKIKEVPEKEGLLFKHINYYLTHDLKLGMNSHGGTKKVIRRYSDFVWLLEFLLQKYPFRIIPGLPPKKFSGSSPDSQFLQRRRRGLHRFLNQLIKHPVLKEEPVVITFLSVPTDISTWRKQAKIDNSIEFKGVKIETEFINSIWPTIGREFLHSWSRADQSINRLIEIWTRVVLLVERYEKRQQQISYDNGKFVEILGAFRAGDTQLYPVGDSIIGESNRDDVNSVNDSLSQLGDFFSKSSQLLVDESYAINTAILEKLKNYLDYLYSLQELFERTKKLSVNTIDVLEKNINANQQALNKLSTEEADIRDGDLAKLRQVIFNDKQEMFRQLNNDWLIKSCCFEEFLMFQETQYLISEVWIEWSKGRFRFQEKMFGLHEGLNGQIANEMPLGR